MRGATRSIHRPHEETIYFNPRAPCGARLHPKHDTHADDRISIHAPHAGRDIGIPNANTDKRISIHAPHAGRDTYSLLKIGRTQDFNPRAPCGARQQKYTNYFTHFCDKRQFLDNFTQNAAF